MRFIVFGLLFLTTAFVAESRSLVKRETTQDDLVKDIQQLRDDVRKELDKLKTEGKEALGKELKMADMALVDLEAQVRRLQPTTEAGKALLAKVEEAFNKLKEKVEQEIKKLDGGFFAEDALEDALLKEVGDLYEQAKKEIETESKTKKDEVVSAIKTAQKVVKDIEDKTKSFHAVGAAEKSLVADFMKLITKGQDILTSALKSVEAGTALADNKAAFVATVKEVYEEAMSVLTKLDKDDKATLKKELTEIITLAKSIQKEIADAIPQIKIAKPLLEGVKGLVDGIVAFLEGKLKDIGSFYEADPIEDALVKQVGDLYDNTKKAIDTLTKTGKDQLVHGLETSIKFVKSIEDKVNTLKPTTDLEKQLVALVTGVAKKGQDYLNEALKDAQSGKTSTVEHKDELIKLAKEIYEKAKAAFEALEKSDKKTLKEHVTKVIALGKEIETDLKALNPTTTIGKAIFEGVNTLVTEVVATLEAKLKDIGTFYAEDALEDALLKEVGDLYEQAKKEIETESKTKKDEVVSAIKTAQKVVKDVEDKTKSFHAVGDAEKSLVTDFMKLITKGEDILASALKSVEAGTALADNKAEFVATVKEVYEKAMSVLTKLDKDDKATLKKELTEIVTLAKSIQKEIADAVPQMKIAKQLFEGVKTLVDGIVAFVEGKLKDVGGYYAEDALEDALVKQVGDLYDNTKKAIDTLTKSGKDQLVHGLETAIKFVKSIEDKVNTLKPTTDLEKELVALVDGVAKKGQEFLNEALKDAQSGKTSTVEHKDELIKLAKEIYEKAKTAFETLEKSDKKTLKEHVTKVIALGKEIATDLKTLKPTTEIGKAIFEGVNTLVTEVVAALEAQLKNIGN